MIVEVIKYVITNKEHTLFRDDWGNMVENIDDCVLSDNSVNLEMTIFDLDKTNLEILPVKITYDYDVKN